jgi:hypothetical protein
MLQKWKSTINIPVVPDATSVEERERAVERRGDRESDGNRQAAASFERRAETREAERRRVDSSGSSLQASSGTAGGRRKGGGVELKMKKMEEEEKGVESGGAVELIRDSAELLKKK